MSGIKFVSSLTLALAIALPSAASAVVFSERDSSLNLDWAATSASEGNFSISSPGTYVDQRDPSLSYGSGVEFSGFALPERPEGESRSARFDHDAHDALRWAAER